jgi:hypothetical protein
VELSFAAAPGVVPHVRTAYETAHGEDGVLVRLRDLYVEERRDVLVELDVPAAVGAVTTLGYLRVRGFSLTSNAYENLGPVAVVVDRGETAGAEDPFVARHASRWRASDALERSRHTAAAGDLSSARSELEAAIVHVQGTALAQGGDSRVLGYVQDMQECMRDLRDRDQYLRVGSKKMACMGEAHSKQRSYNAKMLTPSAAADEYSSVRMKSMGMSFKRAIRPAGL